MLQSVLQPELNADGVRLLHQDRSKHGLELVQRINVFARVKVHADKATWVQIGPFRAVDFGKRQRKLRKVKGLGASTQDLFPNPSCGAVKSCLLHMFPVVWAETLVKTLRPDHTDYTGLVEGTMNSPVLF